MRPIGNPRHPAMLDRIEVNAVEVFVISWPGGYNRPIQSGQSTCYKPGQFYLLLTRRYIPR
jgi:hypothetical protein